MNLRSHSVRGVVEQVCTQCGSLIGDNVVAYRDRNYCCEPCAREAANRHATTLSFGMGESGSETFCEPCWACGKLCDWTTAWVIASGCEETTCHCECLGDRGGQNLSCFV